MINKPQNKDSLALITCSYRPDFERCSRLCATMDTFIDLDTPQFIVVPERDCQLFAQLQTGNRSIVSSQDVLPANFVHLPLLKKWWLDNGLWPVRGWMMQQLTKLCADVITDCENIVFVDSDIEFLTPLQRDRLIHQDALRLHRKPMHRNEGVHLKWHHTSARLLGLTPQYFGSDYIGPLVTWRRSNLVKLKAHIENILHRPWFEAVGRQITVSEYTLYGAFVEHVLGIGNAGHFPSADDLCHCLWFENETDQFLADIDAVSAPQAVLVQSNLGLKPAEVDALINRIRAHLAFPQLDSLGLDK